MRGQRGVTLLELMIVLLVIGILTVIAVPSYREQVNKGNRAEARALLYEVLQKEERFFTENGTFTTTMADMGYAAVLHNEHNTHVVTVAAGATGTLATSVDITATAINDDKCATMTLSNTQQTAATGTAPTTCW